jgi:hypothetical protein
VIRDPDPVGASQGSVKGGSGNDARTWAGYTPDAEIAEHAEKAGAADGRVAGGEDELLVSGEPETRFPRGKRAADKGRRSFLRRAERLGEYNAKGTRCQCLFSR